jgi:hypothetical protein
MNLLAISLAQRWTAVFFLLCAGIELLAAAGASQTLADSARLKGVLITPAQATARQLKRFQAEGFDTAVLYLDDTSSAPKKISSAQLIEKSGLNLCYWIEIGRNPSLADSHPEWMASLQTHSEWRRLFPRFPQPATNQVVKTYPWVPVLYQETFEVHRERVAKLLNNLPAAKGVFLNDLQGAPSACGCGNSFCRWTTDYGPITTATRLPADAAAKFVAAVGKLLPGAKIIPVWTTECAEHDGEKGAACDGVGCYTGRCWKDYNAQLMPVAGIAGQIGVLLPYQDFSPKLSRTGAYGKWQTYALDSFTEILPQRGGQAIPQGRLIAVLQGWNVSVAQQQTQIRQSEQAGTAGYILALAKIDQGWEPRLMNVPTKQAGREKPHSNH